jgi:hypothetical protein
LLYGLPHLTQYAPEPVEQRKLLPDPENEPDFYKISHLFPLPSDHVNNIDEAKAALAERGIYVTSAQSSTILPPPTILDSTSILSAPLFGISNQWLAPLTHSTETANAAPAVALADAARMPPMSNSLSQYASLNLMNQNFTGGDGFPLLWSLLHGETNSVANTLHPILNSYALDMRNDRFHPTAEYNQLLSEWQYNQDRLAVYLQYMATREQDENNANNNNPFHLNRR